MLSFLSPLFLVGAAAVAIPILLHLLRRQPEARVQFAAVRMLRQAPVEHTDRRHLRELLLLALRVAALLLLSLAFARPFFAADTALGASGVTVVALDTSLSLSAPGQFERARELARQAIDAAPSPHAVGVVTFADTADIVAPPSADRGAALAAVNAAQPGLGGTRYRAALTAAAELVRAHGGSGDRVVVVTDLQEIGWDRGDRAALPASAGIEVADVGALPPNLAVTAIQRASPERITVTVRNTGGEAREALLRLAIDGKPGGQARATVSAGQSAQVGFTAARGTVIEVAVEDPAGIAPDNRRFALLDEATRPGVIVVTATGDLSREAFFLREALAVPAPTGLPYEVQGAAAADVGSWAPSRLDGVSAVVLTSTRGLDRRGRDVLIGFIRGGGGLLVAAGPDVDGAVAAGAFEGRLSFAEPTAPAERDPRGGGRTLAPADVRHPIFARFGPGASTLGLVKFRRVVGLDAEGCGTLARFTTGERALVECQIGEGRAIALASDLDNGWNDFPVHASFVPFLHETLAYLSADRPAPGERLIGDLPAGVPPQPGIATLADTGRQVAVNVNPAEADPGRLSEEEFLTAVARPQERDGTTGAPAASTRQEERQHIWQYLLALMIGMLILESFVGTRTA